MILYQIRNNLKKESLFSLSIDPGIETSGFCLLNKQSKEIIQKTEYINFTKNTPYPIYFLDCLEMLLQYKKFIQSNNIKYEELELNIEYTFSQGIFAPGLNTIITATLLEFIHQGINKIILVPAKIPGYFLQTNETIKEYFLLEWFKAYFPEYISDSPHSRDAFLTSLFCHYDLYKEIHKNVLIIRKPVYEIFELKIKDLK